MKVQLKQTLRLFLVSIATGALLAGEPRAAEFDLVLPPDTEQTGGDNGMTAGKRPDDPPHFARRGRIRMMDRILSSVETLEPGDRLKINLFADKPFRIIIDTRERDPFGSQKIIGHIESEKQQTFIMTINDEDFVISLQDLNGDKTYFVSGKTKAGQGEALEVDDRKKPRRIQ
jgi:hypothetical protein